MGCGSSVSNLSIEEEDRLDPNSQKDGVEVEKNAAKKPKGLFSTISSVARKKDADRDQAVTSSTNSSQRYWFCSIFLPQAVSFH